MSDTPAQPARHPPRHGPRRGFQELQGGVSTGFTGPQRGAPQRGRVWRTGTRTTAIATAVFGILLFVAMPQWEEIGVTCTFQGTIHQDRIEGSLYQHQHNLSSQYHILYANRKWLEALHIDLHTQTAYKYGPSERPRVKFALARNARSEGVPTVSRKIMFHCNTWSPDASKLHRPPEIDFPAVDANDISLFHRTLAFCLISPQACR